ncbi:hypothetical protein ACIRON_23160 [Nocardioides sp. NPDC101246]
MRVLNMRPRGAGTGTQAARISGRYDIPALSIGIRSTLGNAHP